MSYLACFKTFGCKLNQAESDSIAESFIENGFELATSFSSASVVVFNTCTVTGKAEQKARREIRLAIRANPSSVVIVTGCYAELESKSLSELDSRLIIIPGSKKNIIANLAPVIISALDAGLSPKEEILSFLLADKHKSYVLPESLNNINNIEDRFAFSIKKSTVHSRRQLKIQDGCNYRCSYCRVCVARGPSVSLDPAEVIKRAQDLEKDGVPEIVLTGVNLAQYKYKNVEFPALLKLLHENTKNLYFRLSSYDPEAVNDDFASAFALPRIQPHIHLSLQSGSDSVLKAMNRRSSRADIIRAAQIVRNVKGDLFLGCDIILGFPTESESDFADTMSLITEIEPTFVHAFPFSPRPGTKAYTMKPCVPERIAASRLSLVEEAAKKNYQKFAERRLGKVIKAVLEQGKPHLFESINLSTKNIELNSFSQKTASNAINQQNNLNNKLFSATSFDYLKLVVKNVPQDRSGIISCKVNKIFNNSLQSENNTYLFADYVEM